MEQDGEEHKHSQCRSHRESAYDGNAIYEGVQQQPRQGGEACDLRDVVCLLAEMEMRSESVLGEVHQQITGEDDEGGAVAIELQRIRNEVQ